MSAIVGYPLKGIDAQVTKGATMKIFDPIISARVAQGEHEYVKISEEEKRNIVEEWHLKIAEKKKSKDKQNT